MNTAEVPDLEQLMDGVQTACDALPCHLDDYWLDSLPDSFHSFSKYSR